MYMYLAWYVEALINNRTTYKVPNFSTVWLHYHFTTTMKPKLHHLPLLASLDCAIVQPHQSYIPSNVSGAFPVLIPSSQEGNRDYPRQ